jgi:putative transposase
VVTDLLADLVARGLRFEHGILAVLDGSKALRKAVVKVFGERALVQRCTLHKRRNVIGYLPVDDRDAIARRLARAFAEPASATGLAAWRNLARQLDGAPPDTPPRCARAWRRCSPSPASASPAGSDAR